MRVLVVDGDPAGRNQVREILEHSFPALEVLEVKGSSDVAAVQGQDEIDVAVVDTMLDGVDWREVIRKLKNRWPAAAVIIYGAEDSAAAAVATLKAGADDYVARSTGDRLTEVVRSHLETGSETSGAARPLVDKSSDTQPGAAEPSGSDEHVAARLEAFLSDHGSEREWTEAVLARQAALLREQSRLLDLTEDAVIVRRLNSTILFWNQGAERRYGWLRSEALGQRSHVLLHTEFPEPIENIYAALLRNGHWSGELIHTRRDGSRLVVDSRWTLQRDDDGRPTAVLELNSDITKRKEAEAAVLEREKALRASEERYRQMFERNRAIKLLIDPDTGAILEANPAACQFYGYTLDQLQGMKIWQLNTLPEPQVIPRLAQAMSGEQSTFVFRHRLASGSIRDVQVNASPIELQGHRLLYSIVHDITERKQAERALWHHTKRLQILRDIDQAILALKSPQEIAQAALHHLRQVVPARQASVVLFEPGRADAEVLAVEEGARGSLVAGQRIPLTETWLPASQWQNNVYLVDDLTEVRDESPASEVLRAEGVRAHLSIPLSAQGQLIGRLNLGSTKPRAFTLQHIDIARQVADSLAVAIQNGRLYESERGARRMAEGLRAANVALTQSLEPDAVYAVVLEHLSDLVPYDSASILLRTPDDQVEVKAMAGYERWASPEELATARTLAFDIDSTPSIARLVRNQQSVVIADARTFEDWRPGPGTGHVRSWLGVPLIARGRLVGLCSLDKVEPGFYTPEHAHLAEALAGQAAVAILNAQLYEEVRMGREQLQTLSRRLVDVQERERRYVARELHDEAGQSLTSLMVNLSLLEREAQCVEPVATRLKDLKRQVSDILEGLHRLAVDLRPASLDHLGLVPALRQYVENLERQSGIAIQFEAFGWNRERLPPEVETSLYRVVQEALTNVLRHAGATQAGVLIERRADRLIAIVEDNGKGFDVDHEMKQGRLGLIGMRERTETLGGQLVIESSAGQGTSVFVELPGMDQAVLPGVES